MCVTKTEFLLARCLAASARITTHSISRSSSSSAFPLSFLSFCLSALNASPFIKDKNVSKLYVKEDSSVHTHTNKQELLSLYSPPWLGSKVTKLLLCLILSSLFDVYVSAEVELGLKGFRSASFLKKNNFYDELCPCVQSEERRRALKLFPSER